ncbi:MAG: PH domain-containing protein [Gemmatimonadota bacterium]|nr:PH domain-containing protein [Gemmatimonadota bacterium]
MGVMAALTGNAAEIPPEKGAELFNQVLMDGEPVHRAYELYRDAFVFTDRRLIAKDAQGLTGKKIEWHSVPYRSISHFAIETAGINDWDAELKIFVSGSQTPAITKKFNRKLSIYEVGNVLSSYICSR